MTPMSAIVTPASASAPVAASAARSTVSLSGCLPNLVIRIPRIQMSSLALIVTPLSGSGSSVRGFEAEADRLGARRVGADRISGQPHFHPVTNVLRIGFDIDKIGAHLGAVAVDHRRDERGGNAGCGKRDDGERSQRALGRNGNGCEFGRETTGARIAPIEESGAAVCAFLRDEVGIAVIEHQIVDQWDLTRHNTSVVCTVDRSECGPITDPEYQDRGVAKLSLPPRQAICVSSSLTIVK